jgi:hypothetical protein
MVETVVTTIEDEFSVPVKKYLKRKEFLVLVICIITFCLSLPNFCPVSFILYSNTYKNEFN